MYVVVFEFCIQLSIHRDYIFEAGYITNWTEGTYKWPDRTCDPTTSFGQCNTNDQTDVDARATAVCALNGYKNIKLFYV